MLSIFVAFCVLFITIPQAWSCEVVGFGHVGFSLVGRPTFLGDRSALFRSVPIRLMTDMSLPPTPDMDISGIPGPRDSRARCGMQEGSRSPVKLE